MRNPERIDKMLDALRKQWKANPDCRFGQLVINMSSKRPIDIDELWNLEDDVLLQKIQSHLLPNEKFDL